MSQYKLREVLSRIKCLGLKHTVSWTALSQMRDNPDEYAKRLMADMVAHHIAGDIMQGGTWKRSAEPHGEIFSVKGYWLTYEELYRLMEEAYSIGRTEPVSTSMEAT
jgi:hypothetical protein